MPLPYLKHLPSGPHSLIGMLVGWSMILVVFVAFWLLDRYLKKKRTKRPYKKKVKERFQRRNNRQSE